MSARNHRTPLIGRHEELKTVRDLFAGGERLITVVGPPGAGKTRFAVELAHADHVSGRPGIAELAESRTAADLARRIADALDVPLDGVAVKEQLGEALAARGSQLLVLDNCEYLDVEARELLDGLLERAPMARLLATSLVPLRVEGEFCFELPSLSLDDAVILYEEQARRSGESAPLAGDAVAALVDRLDRNPLAIRLAAARVRTLRPRQILARLDQRLSLLKGGPPGRHESLRRALACSWELLSPWEASALSQAAIFSGGFDLDAAEAVIDLSDHPDAPPILEVVDGLRAKVLVTATEADPPRFSLLENVRLYACAELERCGHVEETAERHASYYLGIASLEPGVWPSTAHLRRLRIEEENLRTVIRHFERRAPARAVRAALALVSLLEGRGYATCMPHLEAAVETARLAGDPTLLAGTLRTLGKARAHRGEFDEARVVLRQAIELARASGAVIVECHATLDLGFAEVHGGGPHRAGPLVEGAVRVASSLGLVGLEGYAEHLLGSIAEHTGRRDSSAAHLERAGRLMRRCGALGAEAQALVTLGNCRAALGETEAAHQALAQGRALARQAGEPLVESLAMLSLGNVLLVTGDLDEAEALVAGARAMERSFGRPRFEALAAGNLATVSFERGRFREARQLMAEALITFRGVGNTYVNGAFSSVHGAILAASGETGRASREFDVARESVHATGDRELLGMLEVFTGFLDLARAREAGTDGSLHREVARQKRDAGREGTPGGARRIAVRILDRALAGWSGSSPTDPEATTSAPASAGTTLVVGPEAHWFEAGCSPRVDLGRRRAIRRVLQALVEQRLFSPGLGLEPEQLFAAGWPDERAIPQAAAMRVYHAIKVLRQAGLESALLRHGDGYLLDPALPVTKRPS